MTLSFDYCSYIRLEKVTSVEEGFAATKCEENRQKKCKGVLLEENSNVELLEQRYAYHMCYSIIYA